MRITCKTNTIVPASKQVNRVGKYLYNHIDGAFNYKTSPNMFDIYFTLLYQLPRLQQIPGKGKEYNDVHEMTININITTYQNKVRVNVIEMTPEERTLGFDLYPPETLQDLKNAQHIILNKVIRRVSKAYKDYNFLF